MPPKKDLNRSLNQIPSATSFLKTPHSAVPGFNERIETGVPWNLKEKGYRRHRHNRNKPDLPEKEFKNGLENKLRDSFLGPLVDEGSRIPLADQWELLAAVKWNTEMFGTFDDKQCLTLRNIFIDDVTPIIKKAVKANDRNVIRLHLYTVFTLRIMDEQITVVDESISQFKNLTFLNLSSNYLSTLNLSLLPVTLQGLELKDNKFNNISNLVGIFPPYLVYLGLARNEITEVTDIIFASPLNYDFKPLQDSNVSGLDLSRNDIFNPLPVLDGLRTVKDIRSLYLAGNPCAMSIAYGRTVMQHLRLQWLDGREVLESDLSAFSELSASTSTLSGTVPPELKTAYFVFVVYRIMSVLPPPKTEKGQSATFHVEFELPLLDSKRRAFLFYRNVDSLIEMAPWPEDGSPEESNHGMSLSPKFKTLAAASTFESLKSLDGVNKEKKGSEMSTSSLDDIYMHLTEKNARIIKNYTTFETNRIPWAKIMTFGDPSLKLFCPNLTLIRDTFNTEIVVRLVYTLSMASSKEGKVVIPGKTWELVICAVRCTLRQPNWSQSRQDFHWDDTLPDNNAIHYGSGDLGSLQFYIPASNTKKPGGEPVPENLTCHFGFGIETQPIRGEETSKGLLKGKKK